MTSENAHASSVLREPLAKAELSKIERAFRLQAQSIPKVYDEKQLQEIEKSLAAVGVDFNAVVFNVDGRRRSLLEVLQAVAAFVTGATKVKWTPWPTPKKRAAVLKKEITALEAARVALGPVFIPPMIEGDPYCDVDDVRACDVAHGDAHRALEKLIAYKRWYHDALVVKSKSSLNAKTKHVQFWGELAHLWRKLPATEKRQHKHLQAFLWACSVPLFPEATTDKALIAFINRFSAQTSV
jgi:hypothetical protein